MVPADERAAQGQKGLVDVSTPLKARAQPTHLVQPGDRALNGLITSEPLLNFEWVDWLGLRMKAMVDEAC